MACSGTFQVVEPPLGMSVVAVQEQQQADLMHLVVLGEREASFG